MQEMAMSHFPQVAVIGAGTMGHGIALVYALAGCTVRLTDSHPAALERAGPLVDAALDILVDCEVVTAEAARLARGRIQTFSSLAETVEDAGLIIEAVIEDRDIKQALFVELDRLAPADAIIASNTSNLDIFPLVPKHRLPRTLIVHWYAPAYIVDLVDIVGNADTEPSIIENMRAFLTAAGKKPVVLKRFIAGYIANRLQSAWTREVFWLIEQGVAEPADIDAAIKYGLAQRMALLGHAMKSDFGGLALTRRMLADSDYAPPPPRRNFDFLDQMVAKGHTGVMAGRGFYDYGERSPKEILAERDRRLIALKRAVSKIEGDL
jgi:3-hydroxybutyryl-CoA dehydrogenase